MTEGIELILYGCRKGIFNQSHHIFFPGKARHAVKIIDDEQIGPTTWNGFPWRSSTAQSSLLSVLSAEHT